jgi:hypothetical protein
MIILWLYCYCQICMSSKLKHVHCDIQCQHVRLVPPLTYIGDPSLTSISRTEGLVGTSCLDRKCSGYTPSILQSSWDAQFLVETSKNVPSPWHHGATIMGTTQQAGGICLAHGHPSMSATQLAPSPGGCKFWPSQLAWKIRSWNRLAPTRTLLHTYNCHRHHHHQDHPNHNNYLHEGSKFATPSEQYVGWGNNINFIFMRDQNSQHPMSNMLTGVITSTLSSLGIKFRHPLWTVCWVG